MCRKLILAATALIGAGLSLAANDRAQAGAAVPFSQVSVSPPIPLRAATPGQAVSAQAAVAQAAARTETPPRPPRRKATPEERVAAERLPALARAAFWARETDVDPTDQVANLRLAAALRALGQYDEAVASAQRVLVLAPNNADALMEEARAYVGKGQGFYAIAPAEQLRATAPKDWRPLSILGVAYAQVRRRDDAMTAWRQALDLSPDNPAVLANMAMELAAEGDAPQAETLLRRAAVQPGANLIVRQDLTLVLGLQGKLTEAEQRLRVDLPPEQADADLAYLKAVAVGSAAPSPTPAAASATARSWDSVKSSGGS
jgi:Flp pilus assembly protein TadD